MTKKQKFKQLPDKVLSASVRIPRHACQRLEERHGLEHRAASALYIQHHAELYSKVKNPNVKFLYDNGGSWIFQIKQDGQFFYPVLKPVVALQTALIVTYLTSQMVFDNMLK